MDDVVVDPDRIDLLPHPKERPFLVLEERYAVSVPVPPPSLRILVQKLFDIIPPEGYSNSKPDPSREERVGQITEALKIYVVASGGYYPPKSIDVVQKIIDDFKEKRRDEAEFWLTMGDRFIHIRYYPLYSKDGIYKGVLEVTQDVTGIRALDGEQRLLS